MHNVNELPELIVMQMLLFAMYLLHSGRAQMSKLSKKSSCFLRFIAMATELIALCGISFNWAYSEHGTGEGGASRDGWDNGIELEFMGYRKATAVIKHHKKCITTSKMHVPGEYYSLKVQEIKDKHFAEATNGEKREFQSSGIDN